VGGGTELLKNLALEELRILGKELEDYNGHCGELCDDVLHRHHKAKILYIAATHEPDLIVSVAGHAWDYHMVPVVDGIVHDAWHPDLLLPPLEYVQAAFPKQHLRAEVTSGTATEHLELSWQGKNT